MRIAMIGMGAVGSVFGMDLYNAYPNDFFAIASGSRYATPCAWSGLPKMWRRRR